MHRHLPVAALLALSAALTGCSSSGDADVTGPQVKALPASGPLGVLRVEDRPVAPVLSGEDLDGEPLSTADYKGKVVVLNVWASWCGPCRGEAPNLVEVANESAAAGVVFVGVDIKDDRGKAKSFEDRFKVPYRSIYDQQARTLLTFRELVPQVPPTTLILDRQGRIAARFISPLTANELRGPVQVLAREQA